MTGKDHDSNVLGLGHRAKHSENERSLASELVHEFEVSSLPLHLRLQHFARHVRRQDIARMLAKYELFQLNLPVNGSVVECGVYAGAGLLSWHHFSAILEPYNHSRRLIGFDTFEGFPSVDVKDVEHGESEHLKEGAFQTTPEIQRELERLIALHDRNRPLGHIPKIELVAGDATATIPRFLESHPHLLISLLYLDFDIYQPTKVALEHLLQRVVKGGVVAFDELNCADFPGETTALLEVLGLEKVALRRFPFEPYISYFIKE